jgi:hypothetical protein
MKPSFSDSISNGRTFGTLTVSPGLSCSRFIPGFIFRTNDSAAWKRSQMNSSSEPYFSAFILACSDALPETGPTKFSASGGMVYSV